MPILLTTLESEFKTYPEIQKGFTVSTDNSDLVSNKKVKRDVYT